MLKEWCYVSHASLLKKQQIYVFAQWNCVKLNMRKPFTNFNSNNTRSSLNKPLLVDQHQYNLQYLIPIFNVSVTHPDKLKILSNAIS